MKSKKIEKLGLYPIDDVPEAEVADKQISAINNLIQMINLKRAEKGLSPEEREAIDKFATMLNRATKLWNELPRGGQ